MCDPFVSRLWSIHQDVRSFCDPGCDPLTKWCDSFQIQVVNHSQRRVTLSWAMLGSTHSDVCVGGRYTTLDCIYSAVEIQIYCYCTLVLAMLVVCLYNRSPISNKLINKRINLIDFHIILHLVSSNATFSDLKWSVAHQQLHVRVIQNTAHRSSTQASYTQHVGYDQIEKSTMAGSNCSNTR